MLIINGCNCSINAFHHLEIKNKMFEFMHLCTVVVMKQNHLIHYHAQAHRAVVPWQ